MANVFIKEIKFYDVSGRDMQYHRGVSPVEILLPFTTIIQKCGWRNQLKHV